MKVFVVLLTLFIGAFSAVYAEPVKGVLAAVNEYRAGKGRKALVVSPVLQRIAEGHARDMATNGFFSHSGSNGSAPSDRARAGGYRYCLFAENIAKGQKTLAAVMESWITSPPHRKNLLLRKLREVAVARVDGDIWVMVLARPGC